LALMSFFAAAIISHRGCNAQIGSGGTRDRIQKQLQQVNIVRVYIGFIGESKFGRFL